MDPQFVDFGDVREFELAAGVTGRRSSARARC